MAKKLFKNTKVGKFLAGSSIVDTLGSALPDKGLLAIVKNLIQKQPMPIKDKVSVTHKFKSRLNILI